MSLRLSRAGIETAKYVIKHFSPSGSHIILVFRAKRPKPRGNTPTGTHLYEDLCQMGCEKNRDFRPTFALSRK